MAGFTDKPTEKISEDIFGLNHYINGLSNFIIECDTPMTIAIQGDWGSGKTSMMSMIKENMADKIVPIWFNTWQFSQFNMGDQLSIMLMQSMIEAFGISEDKSKNIKKKLSILAQISKNAAVVLTDTLIGGRAADLLDNGLNQYDNMSKDNVNMVKEINYIKSQFQECVNTSLFENKKDRIVIFVDDLDRLQPAKAVELLEVLKLFLDCDNCVFILAIDYQVVSQGVKQKYGALLGDEKGKSFFDKIIQVPFKMPVAQYDVRKYVSTMLKNIGLECSEEETGMYVEIIQSSITCNPRSMKRLFNAYLLLSKVGTGQMLDSMWKKKVLFGVLCLQLSFEDVYNYFSTNRMSITDSFLFILADKVKFSEYKDVEQLRRDLNIKTEDDENQMIRFMKNFVKIIDRDGNDSLSEDEINDFISVLGFSTITSAAKDTNVEDNDERWKFRKASRQIVKSMNSRLREKYKLDFAVYQSNDDRKQEEWKFYYASGWVWLYKNGYPFCINIIIKCDIVTQKFGYEIVIKPEKQTTTNKMVEFLKAYDLEETLSFEMKLGHYSKSSAIMYDESELIELVIHAASEVLDKLKDCFN